MKKNIFLSIIFFGFGFLAHALFFPEVLPNGIESLLQKEQATDQIGSAQKQAPAENNAFMTHVEFDGEQFSRHNLTIEVGSYLTITNTNKEDKLMWLLSNNPLLATSRGYGESEQIRVRMDTKGTFAAINRNNPKEKLVVTVK
jgi:hypothetical protein